jgi:hypothetical protein
MSKIYFRTPTEEAKLSGAERHYMGITRDNYDVKRNHRSSEFVKFLNTSLRVGIDRESPLQHFDGEKFVDFPLFSAILNTTLAIGSDPLKLYARLHGQCEVHTFVEGKNRNWLADITVCIATCPVATTAGR